MKKSLFYSCGEFAAKAHITKKTLRYYDEHDILKPSFLTPSGARFYNDDDLAKLQQILLLKHLGFSLADIREITINGGNRHYLKDSLSLQNKLVEDRIDQLQVIAQMLNNTIDAVEKGQGVDWSRTLDLLYTMGMEKSLKNQYQNSSNISARINLHTRYAKNPKSWFSWIFEQCGLEKGMDILEVGCGDGTFWKENFDRIPDNIHITASDISEGMLRDARRNIGSQDSRFVFQVIDCENISLPERKMDRVIANHVLFYCHNIGQVCKEIYRILRDDGYLICSTYGAKHMMEISELVKEFDDRIVLSGNRLFERFGRENGKQILDEVFDRTEWRAYDDELIVTEPDPLISYILSCHGNQNQYILDRYKEFRQFVRKKTEPGFHITKDAGIFICRKKS